MAFRHPSAKVLALVAAAPAAVQAAFAKAEEENVAESTQLKAWLQAALEGRLDLAERLVDHGLRPEHFRSVLSEFRDQIPIEALDILTELHQEFDRHLQEFRDRPPTEQPKPGDRPDDRDIY